MDKRNEVIQFGENVEGYEVPVLNEREIRASAGIMFLALFTAFMIIQFKQDFLFVKYVVVVFVIDFIIRVFVSPRFSPTLIIGRLIVSNQTPEYVSAAPKKFAWKIGLALSTIMFILIVIVNSYSMITASGCMLCLVFLFFESAFGICLGCIFYNLFYKDEPMYCGGEICEIKEKHAIQKTSRMQIIVIFAMILSIVIITFFLNNYFNIAPKSLKEIISNFLK